MFDDAFEDEAAATLSVPVREPLPESPGAFANLGTAVIDAAPSATFRALRALNLYAGDRGTGYRSDIVPTAKDAHKADIQRLTDDSLKSSIREYTPDPLTTGAASNFVFQATQTVGKAVGYTLMGGPIAGPIAFGLDQGANESLTLQDQGVDEATANEAGVVTGLTSAVSIALPAAAATGWGTAGLVAVGGPGSYMVETSAIQSILEDADYAEIARHYDPFDMTNLALSILPAGAVGALAHGMRVRASSPDDVAAAFALQEAIKVNESALAKPGDIERQNKSIAALETVRNQLDNNEPVSVDMSAADPDIVNERIAMLPDELKTDASREQAELLPPEPAPEAPIVQPDSNAPLEASPMQADAQADPAVTESITVLDTTGDMYIPTGDLDTDGNAITISAREALAQADESINLAQTEARGFEAAVQCFLRNGA